MASSATFMERVFHGELDESILQSYQVSYDPARIDRIANAFSELLREFPSEEMEREGRIPPGALKRMGEAGLFGLSIPQAYGGLGFNLWEYLRVVEELVKQDMAVALASLAHLTIGVKGIELFGTEAQKQKYLVPAASGATIFAYALTEPRIGSDSQHIETRATLSEDGTHYILSGQKTYITNANYAHAMTVFAQLDPAHPGFMGAFIVETHWDGVKIGKDMPKMGLKASSTAAIQLRDVRVPVENLLGKPGDGFKIAMTVLNYGRLALGATSVAMMNLSLADMIRQANTRVQFGQPIKSFPLVQEKIVRTRVNSLAASASNDLIASLLEQDPVANVAIETSHCKLLGTTRGWDAVYDALQVAGGSGYLATNPYEKRMRDFRVTTVFEGTTEIHSIYPALFASRSIVRTLEGKGDGARRNLFLAITVTILRELVGSPTGSWTFAAQHRALRRAFRFCRSAAGTLRRMLLLGLMVHGKRFPQQQFLLRRISTISLTVFTMLAVLARLRADEKAGRLAETDITALQVLLTEARQTVKKNKGVRDSRREILESRIARDLLGKS